MDNFLDSVEEVHLKQGDILVESGKLDTNIYIVKDGIMRYAFMNGLREETVSFAHAGSMMLSMHCYCSNRPAFYQIEACCEANLIKVSKSKFDFFIASYHEFAKWVLCMICAEICFYETERSVFNGDAQERFLSLMRHKPVIAQKVPLKIIASYLRITQAYLSRLRKKHANSR